ncbi:peptidylprolyl isomerase [Oceanibaculum indicum]|uniref:Parvulin-like PPIase n=1 Tax=Oceanibaculum indicum P24 TaxID=1207063 RepID=K2JSG6_9PROT|nr:peptidylprolyl isomerase [Oceanibaculum indicum]EKE68065.1 PPIC-type PPIASE domain-containing protein [Oceanibaculum indicum P24]
MRHPLRSFAPAVTGALLGALIGAVAVPALAQQPAAAGEADPIVASVDGTKIRQSDIAALVATLPQQYRDIPLQMLFPALLERAIDGELLQREAKAAGMAENPEVKRRVERYRDQLIQEQYLTEKLEAAISEDKVKAEYEKLRAEMPKAEEIRASHILVSDEATAKDIVRELDKGADFAALAKEKSIDPGAANGGDLGYFTAEQMVPEFSAAAFELAPGAYSKEPVKSQFGWHVIKVADRRDVAPPSLEQASEQIRAELAEQEARHILAELRAKATIERFSMDGQPLPPQQTQPK